MTKIPQAEIALMIKELSSGAKDLLMYYYSRNDGWIFVEKNIASYIGTSERQLKKFRKELVDNGYLFIQKGQVDVYFIGKLAVHKFKNYDGVTELYEESDEPVPPLISKGVK
jgi:hypothetical protein